MSSIAAIHEAAHFVVAAKSKYHYVFGDVSIEGRLIGSANVTVSRSRLRRTGKGIMNEAAIIRDKEIAVESATIFLSGFASELVYERLKVGSDLPDKSFSAADYELAKDVLLACGLSQALLPALEARASEQVTAHWDSIVLAANLLVMKNNIESIDLIDALGFDMLP